MIIMENEWIIVFFLFVDKSFVIGLCVDEFKCLIVWVFDWLVLVNKILIFFKWWWSYEIGNIEYWWVILLKKIVD